MRPEETSRGVGFGLGCLLRRRVERERLGEETEPVEPAESKWDRPAVLMMGITLFWIVVVATIIGVEIALGVPFR